MSKAHRFPPLAAPETDADRARLAREARLVLLRDWIELAEPLAYVAAALAVVIALYHLPSLI